MDSGGSQPGPHGVNQGQARSNSRRLAAGEARCGGGSAVSGSDNENDGGARPHDAGSEPHHLVAVVELGVAGNIAGDDLGGRRSSVEVEHGARGHGEARGVVFWAPPSAVRAVVC